jgi:hypothetical protein
MFGHMMILVKKGVLYAALLASAVSLSPLANAAVVSISGTIKQTSNGWGAEGVYLSLNNASAPLPCGNGWAIMQSSRPDHKIMVAQLLLAYSIKSNVIITVDDAVCSNGSAIVVGIQLL